ncbi:MULTISPECIES: hypothetical protein [Amycolatopsis]|uniref:hypothetical protein n=1 Tax=Amycolatopsis TaxID=1813 RepID=UPI000B8AC795|nr:MULTISPECIES: hypothetical protein [Amycolatopsis]OXM73100.1 hypothetical protein CF166_11295 [Amycolatopsis sp. KNN50.9b]
MAALTTVALLLPPPPAASQTPGAPRCTWATEYNRTLDELGEDRALWRVGDVPDTGWGEASDEGAVVDALVPCRYVADVVRHEHMHLQQVRQFGSGRFAAFVLGADRIEIVADCASLLAGSRYTPYVDSAGGCSERDLRDARQLLRER